MAAFPYGWQVENANGTPVSGAKIYFYVPTTNTPRNTFTDTALTVPAANPVLADAAGWFRTYLDSDLAYDIVIKSADDAITYQSLTLPAGGASGAQPLNTLLTNISNVTLGNNQFLKGTGTPNTPVAYSLFGTENTWTKKQTIDLAGSETANGIDVQVGAANDLRTTVSSTGYVGHNVEVFTSQDGSGDGITFGVAGRAYSLAGSRGIAVGLYGIGKCDTSWAKGSGFEAGAQGAFLDATTTKAGTVFGAGIHATATTTAGAIIRGVEADTICTTVTNESKIGFEIVSPAADTGATTGTVTIDGGAALEDSAGLRIFAVTGGVGYASGIMTIKRSDTAAPVKSGGNLWSAGGFTTTYGLRWDGMTFSTAAMYVGNTTKIVNARNAANNADINVLRFDSSNRITFYDDKIWMNSLGGVVQNLTGGDAVNLIRVKTDSNGEKYIVYRGVASGFQALEWKVGVGNNDGDFIFARYNDATDAFIENAIIIRKSDGRITIPGVYNTTTATAANVNAAADGIIARSTSALKYKKDVEPYETHRAWPMLEAIDNALIWYRSNTELCTHDNPSYGHYGVAADPLAEEMPQLVHFGETGDVEGFAYERAIVPLIRAVIELRKELDQWKNTPAPHGDLSSSPSSSDALLQPSLSSDTEEPEQDYKAMYEELMRNMYSEVPEDLPIPTFLQSVPHELEDLVRESEPYGETKARLWQLYVNLQSRIADNGLSMDLPTPEQYALHSRLSRHLDWMQGTGAVDVI